MLKSTYTPPPPLPPGWTEHRAPSGSFLGDRNYNNSLTNKQATYITIMRRQSNPHTPDLKRLLQNPNRPPKSHILSQTPFRRFPRLPTPLMGSELAPLRMGLRIMDNLEGAFAAEKAIMTAKVGVRKIARKPSILFPGVPHGFS